MQEPALSLGLAAGPGEGRPGETNYTTLGVVSGRQAESGPRPQRESHPKDSASTVLFLPAACVLRGTRLGMEGQVSTNRGRGWGVPNS